MRQRAKEKGKSRKTAKGVEVAETEGGGGGEGEEAGTDFHNAEGGGRIFKFLRKDWFEAGTATQMDAGLGGFG